ncbi:MAG: metallophosphoesterase [Candidatus Bathyarchaeota archaeon]|nr:metallophosphoesterase [Candidatus Bathyarchaeota archaeon]
MLIGIIADTHDNLPLVEKAVRRLNSENVKLVLHAGDYTSPFTIPKFKALNCNLVGVFGNNDGDHEFLKKRFSENQNCTIHGTFAQVDAEGFKIALIHGHETELLNALVNYGGFDAVISGHTHLSINKTKDKTLVINPGEACGYLYGKPTLALLDTQKRKAEIVEI